MMENDKYIRHNKDKAMFQVGWAGQTSMLRHHKHETSEMKV